MGSLVKICILASCSGMGSLLLRTVHLLQSLKASYPDLRLLVPGILYKLLQEHLVQEEPSGLAVDTHILCWGYDDGLAQDGKEGSGEWWLGGCRGWASGFG